MNDIIDFFTPIHFNNPQTMRERVIDAIEFIFDIWGKSVYVIKGKCRNTILPVTLVHLDQGKFIRILLAVYKICLIFGALKFISSKMVVVPLTMFAIKVGFRKTHTICIQKKLGDDVPKRPQAARPKSTPSISPPLQIPVHAAGDSSVASLMDSFTKAWDSTKKTFNFPANYFHLQRFTAHLKNHTLRFKKADVNREQHFGFLDKFDLDQKENPQIYIRADLHGDLKSLLENLRSLQQQGLLDENFKSRPGVHLVFLGDYCDRGKYGVQILELLMRLREENPGQIHLIRGNHEYVNSNDHWGRMVDPYLREILDDAAARESLELFYETMSLGTYFSLKGDSGKGEKRREYAKCVHALFEVSTDPAPLLDQGISGDHMPVLKERKLSERVRALINNSGSRLSVAAQRIEQLLDQYCRGNTGYDKEWNATAFNWGDVSNDTSNTGSLSGRGYYLNSQDIHHYLKLSSVDHRVKIIFRGHQHRFQHLLYKGTKQEKVLVTTLPVGMDGSYNFDQKDRAYIIKPQFKVKDWTKRALLRSSGQSITELIPECPLTSPMI